MMMRLGAIDDTLAQQIIDENASLRLKYANRVLDIVTGETVNARITSGDVVPLTRGDVLTRISQN